MYIGDKMKKAAIQELQKFHEPKLGVGAFLPWGIVST